MSEPRQPSFEAQFYGQCVLRLVMDLFTGTAKESFSRDQILVILDEVRNDPALFSPEAILAHDEAEREIQES